MKKKHRATIAHHVPGRMRLKIPSGKGNEVLFEEIRQSLAVVPGIHEIIVNPATSSVTVHYAVDAHPELHVSLGQHQDHFEVHTPPSTKLDDMTHMVEAEAEFLAEHSHSAKAVVNFCRHLDREVKKATGNSVDLKVLVPLGLAVVTFVEIGAAAATPVWVTIGLFSINHFVELQAHQARQRREDETRSSSPRTEA
ncbi:HMA2 domain-containing protein [Methyloferula stellata]|uniref:HMA2 domain-containing protein n=1 Tax=Methyloferula stellata TaxID=876270 RepID=UPI000363E50E|nr:hypothetical protein [Methyloferula stellata]